MSDLRKWQCRRRECVDDLIAALSAALDSGCGEGVCEWHSPASVEVRSAGFTAPPEWSHRASRPLRSELW